jgi:hypothetical protein
MELKIRSSAVAVNLEAEIAIRVAPGIERIADNFGVELFLLSCCDVLELVVKMSCA